MPLDVGLIDSHAGSAGVVPPGIELRIIDDEGKDCAAGEAGEIAVKGAAVSEGYWRRPEQTRSVFMEQGWFRTGDVGRMDAEGFLWVIDRKKDMFISGGENVYPAEIERALAGYPNMAECAVVGVGDERWGEVGHLVIVPTQGGDIVIAEVLAYLESRLARYKIPRHVRVSDKLPRNGAGKVMKKELRAMLDAAGSA
jgi:fatty-acyl-CoA synthase